MFEDYYIYQLMKVESDVFEGCYYQRGCGLKRAQRRYGMGGVMKGWACMATPIVKEAIEMWAKKLYLQELY